MRSLLVLLLLCFLSLGSTGCATNGGNDTYPNQRSNWKALHKLKAPEDSFPVWADGDRQLDREEPVRLKVTSSKSGRLWILEVDPLDRFSLVYPNYWARNNQVISHRPMLIPEPGSAWDMTAGQIPGRSILAFIVTTDESDLERMISQSGNATRFSKWLETMSHWGLAKMVLKIE